jgi:hypothetical protein
VTILRRDFDPIAESDASDSEIWVWIHYDGTVVSLFVAVLHSWNHMQNLGGV